MKKHIDIFDSILREGTQSGDELSLEERLAVARLLRDLGVNVIEAGFPGSNELNFETVRRIGREVEGITVCALARIHDADIDAALRSLEGAAQPRVHVFIATSDIHINKKLRMTRSEVLGRSALAVKRIREHCDNIEFSAEDATRSAWDYLVEIFSAVIAAGATVINVPDTVGYTYPTKYKELIRYLRARTRGAEKVTWSVHCHNDLGMAVANSLEGVRAGASQVEGCFWGRGERAGNAQLEPVIMAIHIRQDLFPHRSTSIRTEKLWPTCQEIARLIGCLTPDRYPIIGETAWTHSSGIHDDGVRKARETYEIMTPSLVGWRGARRKLIAEMGGSGLAEAITEIGYPGDEIADVILQQYKRLASAKGVLLSDDLHMLVREYYMEQGNRGKHHFTVDPDRIEYRSGAFGVVTLSQNGTSYETSSTGDGPIDALVRAINIALEKHGVDISELRFEKMQFVQGAGGSEANAWVVVYATLGERTCCARSAHTDTVKAAALAYLRAVNNLLFSPIVNQGN